MRVLLLVTVFRFIIRRELRYEEQHANDIVIILWAVTALLTWIFLASNKPDLFFYRIGYIVDILMTYFCFRTLVRSYDDIRDMIKTISLLVIPLSVFMVIEYKYYYNVLSMLGSNSIPVFVNNEIRCQGAFENSILAGSFGATVFPLCFAMFCTSRKFTKKVLYFVCMVSCLFIVLTSSSSGATFTLIFGIICFFMWKFKVYIRIISTVSITMCILLCIVMKSPIWYLPAKLSAIIGGGGWHRSYLIDQAITHFDRWWLIGTTYTADWLPYRLATNPDMVDITNQYLREGVSGGVLTMFLFILMIVITFKSISKVLNEDQTIESGNALLLWALGCSMFAHAVNFFAVAYFDQIVNFFYFLIAAIASICGKFRRMQDYPGQERDCEQQSN
jgi:hypothetical protein